MNDQQWYAVTATVPADATERVEEAFNDLGASGTAVDLLGRVHQPTQTVTAYFESPPDLEEIGSFLRELLRDGSGTHDVGQQLPALACEKVEQQDWLAEWKKYWRPVTLRRFIIAAPWHDLADISGDTDGRKIVRIEPNMAFGTGTHDTTKLCLEELGEFYRPGMSLLDVGTGTGILSIAASMLGDGSERITAIDIDPPSIEIAKENAELNGVGDRIEFEAGTLDVLGEGTEKFDVVCANVTADVIIPILPRLLALTHQRLILSGILAEQTDDVLAKIPGSILSRTERSGEWVAIIADRRTDA